MRGPNFISYFKIKYMEIAADPQKITLDGEFGVPSELWEVGHIGPDDSGGNRSEIQPIGTFKTQAQSITFRHLAT